MRTLSLLLLLALLAGCSGAALTGPLPGNPTSPAVEMPAATALPTLPPIQTAVPSMTLLPSETAIPVEPVAPTVPVVPTEPPALTPTPTPHPMSIAAMRARAYPGSDIILEQELERGGNYRRFYASYLSEGLKIYGLLTIPDGEPPQGGWPAIVFNHGYIAPSVYRTTERYVAYVDGLARSGYVVFRIDYRGHDRSEGEARGAYGDPGYTVDVINAVTSLQRFPQVNAQKIGMWGHSMGGYLTLRAMVISPEIKAGVIWAGVVGSYPDMLSRWRRTGPSPAPTAPSFARRWRQSWVAEFGTPEQNPAFWASVSANTYVHELSGPVQLHHGTADADVPNYFSEELAQQIQAAGGNVELYIYPDDNHNLSNYFSQAMASTVAFYDQHLKP